MIRAITFDLDMTLQDFLKFKKDGVNAAAKAMIQAGACFELETLEKELFSFYLTDIEGDRVFENFLKSKGIHSEKILALAINSYIKAKLMCLKPYPHVEKTLVSLRGKGLNFGIITDAPRLKAYQRLDLIGLTDYFDFLVGFEDTKQHKPSELPFRKALSILQLEPKDVLHVGDWPDKDILGARSVGMKTCLANYGYMQHMQGKYCEADYKINCFEELEDIIETQGGHGNGKPI